MGDDASCCYAQANPFAFYMCIVNSKRLLCVKEGVARSNTQSHDKLGHCGVVIAAIFVELCGQKKHQSDYCGT